MADNKYAVPFHELGLFRDKASFISLCKLMICFVLSGVLFFGGFVLFLITCEFCNIIVELALCCPWGSS